MIMAATGALWFNVTLAASASGCPSTTQSEGSSLKRAIFSHVPCTNSTSPECIFSSFRFFRIYWRLRWIPKIFTPYFSLKPESFTGLFTRLEAGINTISAIPISVNSSSSLFASTVPSAAWVSNNFNVFSSAKCSTFVKSPNTYRISFSWITVSAAAISWLIVLKKWRREEDNWRRTSIIPTL